MCVEINLQKNAVVEKIFINSQDCRNPYLHLTLQ